MIIRKAESADRDDVGRLHLMAGPNVFRFFFACDEPAALAINNLLYETTNTFCSRRFYYVCESSGTVQGAIGIFPAKDNAVLGKNVGHYLLDVARITGYGAVLKMALRHRVSRRFPALGADELYVEALAVYPEFRGMGISSLLMRHAFAECRRMNFSLVSLFAETNNEKAIAIYHRLGFRIAGTLDLPLKYRENGLYGIHKMIAPVEVLD